MRALLYADPSPSLRWRAAVELADAEDDAEVKAWRAAIAGSREVRGVLDRLAARPSAKDTGYLLCQLRYLGYDGPEVGDAVERIFAAQDRDGSWAVGPGDEPPAKPRRGKRTAPARPREGPRSTTMQTVVPLRGVAAAGYATDPRAEMAYEWLLSQRHVDGSWPADLGGPAAETLPEREYRQLTRGAGCRSATTGAVASLALHPERRRSDAARIGVDHLLAREARGEASLGWEVSRLVGLEPATGGITFYVTLDLAFLLDLASRCGVSPEDRRVRDLVGYVESLRGRHGLWEHPVYPQLSRWLTFDLECSLRRLADGDWIGNEEPASFTPYKRGRRRY